MRENFAKWLTEELNHHNLSIRELGRRSNISHSWIAKVAKGQEPDWNFCAAIGPSLGFSPVEMLLIAGKLTSEDVTKALPMLSAKEVGTTEKVVSIVRELPEKQKEALLLLLNHRDLAAQRLSANSQHA